MLVHKNFGYGSFCCCVGDCVVRPCHLYPLYSWQHMLPTFAEMELDSTTMFTPRTNVMFIRSTGEPVLAQVGGYSEHGDAYRRMSYEREGKTVLPLYSFILQCNFPGDGGPSLGNHPLGGGGGLSSLGWGTTGCGGWGQTT